MAAGHGCVGCSEPQFWDTSTLYRRLPNVPGFGIEQNADKIGLAFCCRCCCAFAIHGALNALRKDKEPPEEKQEGGGETIPAFLRGHDMATTLVLGLGNTIMSDDGIGPKVITRLKETYSGFHLLPSHKLCYNLELLNLCLLRNRLPCLNCFCPRWSFFF